MARILVVDDESAILTVLERFLRLEGHCPLLAKTPEEALAFFDQGTVDLMIVDLRLNADLNGFEVMAEAHKRDPDLPVIVITAYGTVNAAVQAIKQGATDFVCKPFFLNDLRSKIEHGVKTRSTPQPANPPGAELHFGLLLGESPQMQQIYRLIERSANSDCPVLIEGASGTGKELVANAIHRQSRRANRPWTAMNCAAVSPLLLESEMFGHAPGAFTGATSQHDGMFIASHGGTLFLDEIATLRPELQAKLLRTLQDGQVRRLGATEMVPVDVRLLSATNTPLRALVDQGHFREDLFYRLGVIDIHLPPLAQRQGDLPLLARHFCTLESARLGKTIQLPDNTLELLAAYDWPGNVRELQNAISCAAILSDDGLLAADVLPPNLAARSQFLHDQARISKHRQMGGSLDEYLEAIERDYVERVLAKTDGNRSEAANLLGISRATFYRKYGE